MYTEFVNPYNFIPLPDKRENAYGGTDKHTGVIEYTITTQSPLFIPNTSHLRGDDTEKEEHKSLFFYSYNNLEPNTDYSGVYHEPVIPGSEIRGMIRSIYETLTDSCMSVLNEKTYPIMRTQEAFKPALIKRDKTGKLSLESAEECLYTVRKNKYDKTKTYLVEQRAEGSKVYYSVVGDVGGKKKVVLVDEPNQNTPGYLLKGMADGSLEKKHFCHVFVPIATTDKKNPYICDISQNDIQRLKDVVKNYQDLSDGKNAYKGYKNALETFMESKTEGYFPVFYSLIKGIEEQFLYLSPACFTKEQAYYSLEKLAGDFATCRKIEERCPTCDLFGMMGGNNEQSLGSKIRFADGRVAEKKENREYYDEMVTLEELSGPRINNVEFYLQKPQDALFWNYDYYVIEEEIKKNGKIEIVKKVCLAPGVLRGRKFYWHQKDKVLPKNVEKTKRNKTVRPVSSGNTFVGKLYYEGISEKQLNQLLWIMNGGNEAEQPVNGPIAYKLGMGKPLGLGSVELKVSKVLERVISLKEDTISYDLVESNDTIPMYDEVGFSKSVKTDFFTISSLEATKDKLVTYPVTKEQLGELLKTGAMEEGFNWFTENHAVYNPNTLKPKNLRFRRDMVRHHALPSISDGGALPIIEKPTAATINAPRGQEGNRNQNQNRNNSQKQQFTKIKCFTTRDAMPSNKGDGYIVWASYVDTATNQKYKGIVFDVPATLKTNTSIEATVRQIGPDFRGKFVK